MKRREERGKGRESQNSKLNNETIQRLEREEILTSRVFSCNQKHRKQNLDPSRAKERREEGRESSKEGKREGGSVRGRSDGSSERSLAKRREGEKRARVG